jgi:hypothetical protein
VSRPKLCPHCGGELGHVARMTLSLPADLAQWLRQSAERRNMTVSALVGEAIRLRREAEHVAA